MARRSPEKGVPPRKARARSAPPALREQQTLEFTRKNWILFAAGLLAIAAGYALLAAGDITVAPILLVGGYVGLIPWALVARARARGESKPSQDIR